MDQPLLVFITVAEKRNFSRAAEELHMTQPAVSQYIQALERDFGTRLLERNNKYVGLNKAGEIVYHHAKEILGLYSKMQRLIDDTTNKTSGPLTIGASYTFGEYVLPRIMVKMLDQYPLVKPNISIGNTKEIAELVLQNQLDVGIVEGEFKSKKLIIEPFAKDTMYVVVGRQHPLAKVEGEIKPSELKDETWIVREDGSGTRDASEAMFRLLAIDPANLMEFGSIQLIKESVEAGIGISMLSHWAIRKELSMGVLQILNVQGLPFTREFSIVTTSPFRTKALDTFIDMVRKERIDKDTAEFQ
ncbi:LysR family transcriptional regulator [Bacillus niameyensis]|uniref:LysR family transcriptional regulator n=1 Tax=Bacillus niameyensis TaxID=1522308 RepID=UPI000783ABE2|nr:LysR family transcriptional regulator [Bacillus niameyensis]